MAQCPNPNEALNEILPKCVFILHYNPARGVRIHCPPPPNPNPNGPKPMTTPRLPEKPPKKPMSDARIGGMVATVVLILMFIFVGVFVWMGS